MTGLPGGAYLAWTYAGGHGRVYWDDGRVEAFDAHGREVLCRFTSEQLAEAQAAVVAHLAGARAPAPDTFDAAGVIYTWSIDGRGGTFAYRFPPEPPPIEALEQRLAELEEAAGGWPLLAD